MHTTFRCKAILFDPDGVLVNSNECIDGAWRRWAEANRLGPDRPTH